MAHEYTSEQFKDPGVKLGTGDLFNQEAPAAMSVEDELKLLKKQNKNRLGRKKEPKMDHSLQTSMFENKFRAFLDSLKTDENENIINHIIEGFDITHPKT